MEGGQPPNQANSSKVKIPLSQFRAKFASKNECWIFVTQEMKAYVPSQKDTITNLHLRDIAFKTKKSVSSDSIKHLTVPHYESLSVEKILAWAASFCPDVRRDYFPDLDRETLKLPRQVSRRMFLTQTKVADFLI